MRQIDIVLLVMCMTCVSARAATIPDEYSKLISSRGTIQAFDSNLFGDTINLYTGALEVVQTDVDIPGNSPLFVRIGRRFKMLGSDAIRGGHFGDWDLDIPRVHGVFSTTFGWNSSRCTYFGSPDNVSADNGPDGGGEFAATEYWHGTYMYLPGAGDQIMLNATPMSHLPNDGQTYRVVLKDGTAVRCLSSLAATSQSGSSGQGFEAVAPDGTTYTFNHMVRRDYSEIRKSAPIPMSFAKKAGSSVIVQPMASEQYQLSRQEYSIFPTRVTDRFGNWVAYNWSTTNPWQLLSITASDGRAITIGYAGASGNRVKSVSDGVHSWQYGYANGDLGIDSYLISETLPDGRGWSFSMQGLYRSRSGSNAENCDVTGQFAGSMFNGSMTHPSGVSVQYVPQYFLAGRSWVPRECMQTDTSEPFLHTYALYPYRFYMVGVSTKTLTGPGLPTAGYKWTYSFGADNGCWQPGSWQQGPFISEGVACAANSPTTRTVTVVGPNSDVTRYTFGNRYMVDEGKLLRMEEGVTSNGASRTTVNTYANPAAGPYPEYVGESSLRRGDDDFESKSTPLRQRTVTQDGREFVWAVASDCTSMPYCFDSLARPTKVVKRSASSP